MTACPHCPHRPASIEALDAHVAAVHGMKAGTDAVVCPTWSSSGEHVADPETIYDAMLAASPPPTDAEIDAIFLKFRAHVDRVIPSRVTDEDRTRMRAFLAALTGAKP